MKPITNCQAGNFSTKKHVLTQAKVKASLPGDVVFTNAKDVGSHLPCKKGWANIVVVALLLLVSSLLQAQNAQQATGGTGALKNQIWWANFSGVSLAPGNTLSRNFTIGNIAVTVTISDISFSGQQGDVSPATNLSSVRLIGYTPGTWRGDGLDNLYNIGGTGPSSTLCNALAANVNGNAGSANSTDLALISNFKITAYATLSGRPVSLALVYASAESDVASLVASNSTVGEYTQGTTNGSAWQLIDKWTEPNSVSGARIIRFSNSDLTALMTMGSRTDGTSEANAIPANVGILSTGKSATSAANPLIVDARTSSGGKTAMAIGFIVAADGGDLPATFGNSRNILVPAVTGGTNPNAGGVGNAYLANGLASPTPIIAVGSVVNPTTLKIGTNAADADFTIVNTALANGDDISGSTPDDEDGLNGINIVGLTTTLTSYSLPNIPVTNTTGTTAKLVGWIDFNHNGTFETGESASATVVNGATSASLSWSGLSGVTAGAVNIRLKLSTDTDLTTATPTGENVDGETEDYSFPPPTISGSVWNDKNSNGLTETGELVLTPTLYANLIQNGLVIDRIAVSGGTYTLNAPVNTSGLSVVLSQNLVAIGAAATTLTSTAPTNYGYTLDNIGGVPNSATAGTAQTSSNNITGITTANTNLINYNFGLALTLPAFTCANGVSYQIIGNPSALYAVNLATGLKSMIFNAATLGNLNLNGLGYNPLDNYLYAAVSGTSNIVRIGANGSSMVIPVAGLTAAAWTAGAISPDGILYLYVSSTGTTIQKIDLSTLAVSSITIATSSFQDFAISADNTRILGISVTNGNLLSYSTSGGAVTSTAVGLTTMSTSIFLDNVGTLYAINDANSTVYRVTTPSTPTGTSGSQLSPTLAVAITNTDGARCATSALGNYSISGNVFNDLTSDGIVNGGGTNIGNTLNAVLYDNTTGIVAATTAVSAAGAYNFAANLGDNYSVYMTTATVTVGQTALPVVTLPAGYVNTGEHIGAGAGDDGNANGILPLGVVSASVAQANFGTLLAAVCTSGVVYAVNFTATTTPAVGAQQGLYTINPTTEATTLVATNLFGGGAAATMAAAGGSAQTSAIALDIFTNTIWFCNRGNLTDGSPKIFSYNLSATANTGHGTTVATFAGLTTTQSINKAAFNPVDKKVYFHNGSVNGNLYRFDPATPSVAAVNLGPLTVTGFTGTSDFQGGDIGFDGLGNLTGAFTTANILAIFPAQYDAAGNYTGLSLTGQTFGPLGSAPGSIAFLSDGNYLVGGTSGTANINTNTAVETDLGATNFASTDFASCAAPSPNLVVSQTASLNCFTSTLTYTITVQNTGLFHAINTRLINALPAGVTLVSATLNGTTVATTNIATTGILIKSTNATTDGQVFKGETATIVLNCTVAANTGGSISNQAFVKYNGVESLNLANDQIPSNDPATGAANDATVVAGCIKVSGTVYNDIDGPTGGVNGTPMPAGTGLTLYAANGTTAIATTATDASGNYSFSVLAGSYQVNVTAPPLGFSLVSSTDGTPLTPTAVTASTSDVTGVNFGLQSVGTGFVYIHKKAQDELTAQNFTFSVTGGPTSVSNITVNDDPASIPTQDIGSSQSGRLYAVSSGTATPANTLFYRNLNSSAWVNTGIGSVSRVDGGATNTAYYITTNGNVWLYGGSGSTGTTIFTGTATDVGSAWDNQPYVLANGGIVYRYTGSGSGTFASASWPRFNNSASGLVKIDGNPANQAVPVAASGDDNLYTIPAAAASAVSLGKPAGTGASDAEDIAVDAAGNIFAIYFNITASIGQGYDTYKWQSGTTWSGAELTSRSLRVLTAGVGGQVWAGAWYQTVAPYGNIRTRTLAGTTPYWLNDERVRTSVAASNSALMAVTAGTYTLEEILPTGWDLLSINVYDPTSNSTSNLAAHTTTLVVANGETVNVEYTNQFLNLVAAGNSCGTTVIQTFGSGTPAFSPAPAGLTTYHYEGAGGQVDGSYNLAKNTSAWTNTTLTDHTGLTNGYFMTINSSFAQDEFFRQRVTGLITGVSYTLSFWAADLSPAPAGLQRPNVTLGVTNLATGVTQSTATGNITATSWTQYTFTFTATNPVVDVFIRNNGSGGGGNDVAIDDVAFGFTAPPQPVTTVAASSCAALGSITVTSPVDAVNDIYEYSINGTTYQTSTLFSNLASGTYSVTARYKNTTGCVSVAKVDVINPNICGNVWNDASGNAVKDGTEPFITNGSVWVNLVNPATNDVIQSVQVDGSGNYSFNGVAPSTGYQLILSNVSQAGNLNLTAATLQTGFVNTGVNLSGTANTANKTGIITINSGTSGLTNQNFGIEQPPTAVADQSLLNAGGTTVTINPLTNDTDAAPGTLDATKVSLVNPGGATGVVTDANGDITSMTITGQGVWTVDPVTGFISFAPQVGFLGNPTAINYNVEDNASQQSNNATVTITYIPSVYITGTVINDANGNTTIQAGETGTGTGLASPLYVYLVNGSGIVTGAATVAANGTYSLIGAQNASYTAYLSTMVYPVGTNTSTIPISTAPPTGWVTTGENGNGSSDGTPNGVLGISTGATDKTNQNFGIEARPTAGNGTGTAVNPGGTQQVPAVFLNGTVSSDPSPGAVTGIRITSFPMGATSIIIGTTTYTAANVAALTALIIPTDANGIPSVLITVDPTDNGATTVTIPYVARDAANAESSNIGGAVLNLTDLTIRGVVHNDANAGTIDGPGIGSPSSTVAIQQLYANLVSGTTILGSVPVNADGTYALGNANGVQANSTYTVTLSPTAGAAGAASSTLAAITTIAGNWVSTAEGNSGTTGDGTPNGSQTVAITSTDATGKGFGIEQKPTAVADASSGNTSGTAVAINPLANDSDPSPGNLDATTVSLVVPSGATNVVTDANGDITSLTVPNQGIWSVNTTSGVITFTPQAGYLGNPTPISYNVEDNAGKQSNDATVTITYQPSITISGTIIHDINGNTTIQTGETGTASGLPTPLYVYLVNNSGIVVGAATVAANGTYSIAAAQNTPYTLELSNTVYSIGANTNTTPINVTPPTGWVTTGENGNGSSDGNPDGKLMVITTTSSTASQNFGLEKPPLANNVVGSFSNSLGTTAVQVPILNGSDPEQGTFPGTGNGDTIKIVTLPAAGTLAYNGSPVGVGQVINNYNPTLLTFLALAGAGTYTFTYSELDAALQPSVPATVKMKFANTTYCIPFITQACNISRLTNVKLGTVCGTPANAAYINDDLPICSDDSLGYNDRTGIVPTPVVVRGTSLYLSISNLGGYGEGMAGWIDANNNGVFEASENVFQYSETGGGEDFCNGTGYNTSPLTPGYYRIRVVAGNSLTGIVNPTDACATLPDGSFADYLIKIEAPPVANADQSLNNPAGPVSISVVNNDMDVDGTIDATTVNLIVPAGATAVTNDVNGDVISLTIPNEGTWTVDPTTGTITFAPQVGYTGNPTIISYNVKDNDGLKSNNATVTITYPIPLTISGHIFNDANGLAASAGGAANTVDGTAVNGGDIDNATAGNQPLYVSLLDAGGALITTVAVQPDGTYTFPNVAVGNYSLVITANQPGSTTPGLPLANWVYTGEQVGTNAGNDGETGGSTADGKLAVTVTNAAGVTNANFGIQRLPTPTPALEGSFTTVTENQKYPLSSESGLLPLSGTDPEDVTVGAGNSVGITSLPVDGKLYYNNVRITDVSGPNGFIIPNYVPELLTFSFDNTHVITTSFTYKVADKAGDFSTGTGTYTINALSILPVTGLQVKATLANGIPHISWTTISEQNTNRFAVERSLDGIHFTSVGTVAAAGNSNTASSYSFSDNSAGHSNIVYYRIKLVDNDGKTRLSAIVGLTLADVMAINVFPNPAKDFVTVSGLNGKSEIRLLDISGRLLQKENTGNATRLISLKAYAAGTYIVQVIEEGKKITMKRIVKE